MLGFLAASWAWSWTLAEMFSDSQIAQQVWPSDINAQVVECLGGLISQDALGRSVATLGILDVWLRLLAATGMVTLVVCITRKQASGGRTRHVLIEDALRQSSAVLLVGAGSWLLWLAGSETVRQFVSGSVGLWLTMTSACFLWVWINAACCDDQRRQLTSESVCTRAPITILLLSIAGWVTVSYWMNACLYDQLLIPHGDSAMYEEHLWNIRHGKGFRSYLDQGLFLGEHIQVIHLLLLPLHMIWPSHLLLELAESIALGSCAIPVFMMTRRHTGSQWAGVFMGLAWLAFFPMHYLDIAIDQKTFRPIALGLPFLFWTIDLFERRRYRSAAICLLLTLSAKEDYALIAFPLMAVFAFETLWQSRRGEQGQCPSEHRTTFRWAVAMALFSALYLAAVVLVIIPAFRSGDHVHYSRYFGDLGSSPADLVRTFLTQPGKVFGQLLSAQTAVYLFVFIGPMVFWPLRKPRLLLAGGLTFSMLALLQFGTDGNDLPPVPFHHFHAPLLPILFWTAIVAIGITENRQHSGPDNKPGRRSRIRWLTQYVPRNVTATSSALLIMLCCIGTAVTGSLTPYGAAFWSTESPFGRQALYQPVSPDQQQRALMASRVVEQIPLSARVASTDFIHTRLTHCERSYDYSKYLRAVNNFQPGVPPDTEYIVIDTGHRYSDIRSAADVPELQGNTNWELLPGTTNGYFLVLRRK
ncbi:MAG: DUF2079 domain-containing protein [Fuerstiella sp.]|nr:DUF2079 domain-containing protein [Fuerstiella sp.]